MEKRDEAEPVPLAPAPPDRLLHGPKRNLAAILFRLALSRLSFPFWLRFGFLCHAPIIASGGSLSSTRNFKLYRTKRLRHERLIEAQRFRAGCSARPREPTS